MECKSQVSRSEVKQIKQMRAWGQWRVLIIPLLCLLPEHLTNLCWDIMKESANAHIFSRSPPELKSASVACRTNERRRLNSCCCCCYAGTKLCAQARRLPAARGGHHQQMKNELGGWSSKIKAAAKLPRFRATKKRTDVARCCMFCDVLYYAQQGLDGGMRAGKNPTKFDILKRKKKRNN